MPKIEQRNYSIAGKEMEDIVDQVRFILGYDGDVAKVVITRGNILAEYVVEDSEPPYGNIPDSPAATVGDVLSKISLEPVGDHKEVDLDSLAVIASALIQARKAMRTGVAWLVSDSTKFMEWIGVEKPVGRLLSVPVYVVDEEKLPRNKLVLLCGLTSAVSPLKGDFGVIMDMGD